MNVKSNNVFLEFKPPTASSYFKATVSNTALAYADFTIPAAFPSGCQYVHFQVQAQPLRATFDGTTPTATVGKSYAALADETVSLATFKAMKWIREGGSDSTLWVQCFGV